jgi:hypothetical protein
MSTDLKSRRFWIEKKKGSGKYDRPIGAPHKEWRVYAFMQTDLYERILQAQGLMTEWQHGGRSSKGLVTAWKALIPMLKEDNIYEFDLKGFFNNVSHESIGQYVNPHLGIFGRVINGILEKKNNFTEIHLPPRETETTKETTEHMFNVIGNTEEYRKLNAEGKMEVLKPKVRPGWWDLLEDWEKRMKRDEERGTTGEGNTYPLTEAERAEVRERSMGLDKKNSGVPQGLSWSPLISTVTLERIISQTPPFNGTEYDGRYSRLLMYMDDGLIVGNKSSFVERSIRSFKRGIGKMGVEIAEEKSGWIKRDGKWQVDKFKFLGLEYHHKTDQLVSRTRNGTCKEIPIKGDHDKAMEIASRNPDLDMPYLTRKEMDEIINTKAYEAGLKYGFLGCLISESMDPNPKTTRITKMKEVVEGQDRSWLKILKETSDWAQLAGYTRGFGGENYIWKFQDLYEVIAEKVPGVRASWSTLTNTSSVMCAAFMMPGFRSKILGRRRARRAHSKIRYATQASSGLSESKKYGRHY